MANVIIRNLPDEIHRALKLRAAQHGRSTEAEIRDILGKATSAERQVKLGSLLAEIGHEARMTEDEWAAFESATTRDETSAEPLSFE
jgi:antitoxin FitA